MGFIKIIFINCLELVFIKLRCVWIFVLIWVYLRYFYVYLLNIYIYIWNDVDLFGLILICILYIKLLNSIYS